VAAPAGDDDLGRFGEIELGQAGGAEPLAVAGADHVAGRPVDWHRLADAADGGAFAAGGCGPDGIWQVSGAEGGECPGQDGRCFAGERGEGEDGTGQRRGQHVMLAAVVVVADLGAEPGREDGQQVIGGDVVGRGEPAEVGGEDFPSSNRTSAHAASGARRSTPPPSTNPSSNPEPEPAGSTRSPTSETDITRKMIPNRANYGGKTRRTSKIHWQKGRSTVTGQLPHIALLTTALKSAYRNTAFLSTDTTAELRKLLITGGRE